MSRRMRLLGSTALFLLAHMALSVALTVWSVTRSMEIDHRRLEPSWLDAPLQYLSAALLMPLFVLVNHFYRGLFAGAGDVVVLALNSAIWAAVFYWWRFAQSSKATKSEDLL